MAGIRLIPQTAGPIALRNLLWLRCAAAADAVKAADLLLRDGNFRWSFSTWRSSGGRAAENSAE